MPEMHECANRGMGFGHNWKRNVDYVGDFEPNTSKFTVLRRRYDICNPRWGGCGLVRCYMFGMYAIDVAARYDQNTGLQYDKENGEERPTAAAIQAWLDGIPAVVEEVNKRQQQKAKRKTAA